MGLCIRVVVRWRVCVRMCDDDIGRNPHLDTSTAAGRCRYSCPAYQRTFFVFEDGEC